MFSLNDKRAMNQGFGDGMSRAFELVVTPLLFGAFGYLVDTVAGTSPVFVVALSLFAVVGTFVRMWFGYDAEMRSHEATGRWAPRNGSTATVDALPGDLWTAKRSSSGRGTDA